MARPEYGYGQHKESGTVKRIWALYKEDDADSQSRTSNIEGPCCEGVICCIGSIHLYYADCKGPDKQTARMQLQYSLLDRCLFLHWNVNCNYDLNGL